MIGILFNAVRTVAAPTLASIFAREAAKTAGIAAGTALVSGAVYMAKRAAGKRNSPREIEYRRGNANRYQ